MNMQALRFATVGVINTLIGLMCIYGCMYVLNLNYIAANSVGYAVGIVISFLLNKSWTFNHKGHWLEAFVKWLPVVGIAYALNLASVVASHRYFGISEAIAQLVGVFVYSVMSFLGGRYFAFALRQDRSEETICL